MTLERQLAGALAAGLDAEFEAALDRARALDEAIRNGMLPLGLRDASGLGQASGDLADSVREWAVAHADGLAVLRRYTAACAADPDMVGGDSRFNFCNHVTLAEASLREHLMQTRSAG